MELESSRTATRRLSDSLRFHPTWPAALTGWLLLKRSGECIHIGLRESEAENCINKSLGVALRDGDVAAALVNSAPGS